MFTLDFTVNTNPKRKCLVCDKAIGKGKLTMLVTYSGHGVAYESAYHFTCVEQKADEFATEESVRFTRLKERIESGGRLFA